MFKQIQDCADFSEEVFLLVPSTGGTPEIAFGKSLGIAQLDLLWMANRYSSWLQELSTILDLLEYVLHWLLRLPCLAYIFEIVL
jgi:hypothetical protein